MDIEMEERRPVLSDGTEPPESLFTMSTTTDVEKAEFQQLFADNLYETVIYCTVFGTFGMSIAFLGPTLWDLGCQTATTMPAMTRVFFAQSLFILIGSLAAGKLLTHIEDKKLNLYCVGMVAISFFLLSTCGSVGTLSCVLGLMGFHLGIMDTTVNVSMINLYGEHVAPFLQVLHFCYGLGAFLSPLVAKPFLQNLDCTALIDNATMADSRMEQEFLTGHMDEQNDQPESLEDAQRRLHVHTAFQIMAVLQVPTFLLLCHMNCRSTKDPAAKRTICDIDAAKLALAKPRLGFILALCGMLLFIADGLQALFGSFIFSYSRLTVKSLDIQQAITLNALFWGAFAVGRIASCVAAVYVVPALLLLVDLVGVLTATLLLTCIAGNLFALVVGTGLFGLSISSVCPTTLSLISRTAKINPADVGYIVVAAAFGEMLYPLVSGSLLDQYGSFSFLVVCDVSASAMLLLFILLQHYSPTAIGTHIQAGR